MTIEENWAVDPKRVRDFFAAQPGAVETEDGFWLEDCRIHLTAVPSMLLGKFPVTRTLLRLEGEQDAVKAVHHRFFLQFLSAGG